MFKNEKLNLGDGEGVRGVWMTGTVSAPFVGVLAVVMYFCIVDNISKVISLERRC